MAYVDCVIDTEPMAHEMDSVSTQIQGTTAAVVGMKAAVIQAEEMAANHVCENVNKGFYTLIHSQISQKIARLQSEVDSHLMKLNQLRKQLLSIKGRMERDYGMISQRYIKLFNGLNKNLQQRVYELDRPVVEFAVRDVNTVTNRKKILTATVPVAQQESLSLSQKIISSNMKYRGMRVIESMSRFLADMNEQKKLTAQILLPVRNMTETHTSLLVPVIICESNNDKYGNKQVNIRTVDFGLTQKAREEIVSSVNAEFMKFDWQDETINSEIRSEFSKYLSASSSSQRVKDMANKLFMANSFQTIKKQQV